MLWATGLLVRIHGELRRSAPVYAARLEAGVVVDPSDGETAVLARDAVNPKALDTSIGVESAAEAASAVTARKNAIAAALCSRVQRLFW